MQKKFMPVSLFALSLLLASVAQAAVPKCTVEKSAYDRASSDYMRADAQYMRLQWQVDSKYDQAVYKRSILEGNVDQAAANLKAAESIAVGQSLGCIFVPYGWCGGPTISSAMIRISRARATLRTQQGRLVAFNKAYDQQMTRLSQRVSQQETLVNTMKATLDQKEAAYTACMAAA